MLPPLDEVLASCHVVALPLRVRFRGVEVREALLLHGPAGWGEFSPFPEYGDDEAARWLASALASAWHGHPAPVRTGVAVNATVPAVPADQVADVLARFPGCTTAKIKVAEPGQSLDDDLDRVAAVRDVLGPTGAIRVDANGAWDVDAALAALTRLAPFDLQYAEQPCADLAGLKGLRLALARSGIEVAVAADESVRKAEDPLRVAVTGAADVIVIKVAPLGGVGAALEVARTLGEDHGLPVVVSSALDTSVGIAAGVALAAALPDLPFACGLGTASLFTGDVTTEPLVPENGMIAVRTVEPDTERLAALAAPAQREEWWRARLARCHAVLAGNMTA